MENVKEDENTSLVETDTKLIVLNKTIEEVLAQAKPIKVINKESFDLAQVVLSDILIKKKAVSAYWKDSIDRAFEAKKKASEALRGVRDLEIDSLYQLESAERILLNAREKFKTEQDRKDRAEQKRLQDIADKKAKKEQDKLMKKAESATSTREEEEILEEAEEVTAAPVFANKTIKKSVRTESGTLNTWVEEIQVEITDIKKVCALIGNSQLPVNCVTISAAKIKAHVKANNKKDGKYEGYNVRRTQKERITLDGRN